MDVAGDFSLGETGSVTIDAPYGIDSGEYVLVVADSIQGGENISGWTLAMPPVCRKRAKLAIRGGRLMLLVRDGGFRILFH